MRPQCGCVSQTVGHTKISFNSLANAPGGCTIGASLGLHRTGPRLVVKTFPVEARLFRHRWFFLVEKGL
jgi:hypothetical protein